MKKAIQQILLLSLIILSCNKKEEINIPPSIDKITANPNKLSYGSISKIEVFTNDPNNDELSYIWTCDKGEIIGSTTGKSITWKAPSQVEKCNCSVKISDGQEEVSSKISLEVMGNFYEGFIDYSKNWFTQDANAVIKDNAAHIKGTKFDYDGLLVHEFKDALDPEYEIIMDLSRNFHFEKEDEYYFMTLEGENQLNNIEILAYSLFILPNNSSKNWILSCFIYDHILGQGEWVLFDQNSTGFSWSIKTDLKVMNHLSFSINKNNSIYIKINETLVYHSNLLSEYSMPKFKVKYIGAGTMWMNEIIMDDVIVKTTNKDNLNTNKNSNYKRPIIPSLDLNKRNKLKILKSIFQK